MQRSFITRILSLISLTVGALSAAALPAACGSDETEDGTGPTGATGGCSGIEIDGVCEPKCDPAVCLQGLDAGVSTNSCVGNTCALDCTSHTDCFNLNNGAGFPVPGQGYLQHTQDCSAAVADDTNAPVQVCQSNGKARGYGYACPFGNECVDAHKLYACPNGAPCDGPNAPSCDPIDADANGTVDNVCEKDVALCRGKPDCTSGRCTITKAPCSLTAQCTPDLCQPLNCLTSGMGDADAYCTRFDCAEDLDCPGGFYCGVIKVAQDICGIDKGPSFFGACGVETVGDCVDPADFTANGATYAEGPTCLLRNACLKKEPCASCTTNLDCNSVPDMRCAKQPSDGAPVCGKLCNPANGDKDCEANYRCDPGGLLVPEGAFGACVHRFGQCKGTGGFCEPCLSDLDCDGATCITATGHEKACFMIPFDTSCDSGSDSECPESPSGSNGECLDSGEGVPTSNPAYHMCYLPIDTSTNKTGCWY